MKSRLKAFALHLLCSMALALISLYVVFFVWYPEPLAQALAVADIFIMLLAIDVVLGPLLTLIVYKQGKKTLRFDLTVIVVLQLAALCYGLWTVSGARPAWLVYSVDRFEVVQAVAIDNSHIERAQPEYKRAPLFGPQWVAAELPADAEQKKQLMFDSLAGGADIAQRPDLYRPLESVSAQLAHKAQPLDRLSEFNAPEVVAVQLAQAPTASGWLPLQTKTNSMVVLLTDNNQRVLKIVPLNPWN